MRFSFDESRSAALVIQDIYREVRLRRQHQALQRTRSAASTISRGWKSHIFRSRVHAHLNQLRVCQAKATLIQAKWRSFRAREELHRFVAAAVLIQSVGRSGAARSRIRREQSAAKLQSRLRGHFARNMLVKSRAAATIFQALFRGKIARRMKQRTIAAANVIQLRWRGYLRISREKETLRLQHLQNHCATLIQSRWRSWHARKQYCKLRATVKTDAARIIERAWQSYALSPAYTDIRRKRHAAATKIQAVYIDWRMQQVLQKLDSAAELLRRTLRGVFARSTSVYALLLIKVALRASTAMTSFRRDASPTTNSRLLTRRELDRKEAMAKNLTAIIVQSFARGCMCRMRLSTHQRPSRQPFSVIPLKPSEESSPGTEVRIPIRHSPTSVRASDLGCVYVRRFENRASRALFDRADILASVHVAHLLDEYGVPSAPCLLRLASSTREIQRLSRAAARDDATLFSHAERDI